MYINEVSSYANFCVEEDGGISRDAADEAYGCKAEVINRLYAIERF